ncbi:hypothetical protein GCM10027347_43470 [Larkinella harenae]
MEEITPSDRHLTDGLDRERLQELYGDDTEMLVSAMSMFLDEVMPNFLELEKRIGEENWTEVAQLTHQLRPWLGMVGLTNLEKQLYEIEELARQNPERAVVMFIFNDFRSHLALIPALLKIELHRIS